jgi:hypothetical protein
LVEGLELGAPDEPLFQLPEPAFDEGLRFGVAVAAAAVSEAVLGESVLEAAAGVGGAVVGAECEAARFDLSCADGVVDEVDRFVGAAAQLERPADDLACAAVDRGVQVGLAVLGDPDARHVEVPELVGTLDAEVAGTAAPAKRPVALQQPLLAHHPLRSLAVDLAAELAACERSDHPRSVGRIGTSNINDQAVDRINERPPRRCRPSLRRAVEPAAVDLQHTRHHRRPSALGDQLAGPGGARPHSQPRNASPAISSS